MEDKGGYNKPGRDKEVSEEVSYKRDAAVTNLLNRLRTSEEISKKSVIRK